jgi:predicted house-cleaning noncanonical NTP pyrophosphatase (MazG superfamily)
MKTEKLRDILNLIFKTLNSFNLTTEELIEVIGNINFCTGKSIAGVDFNPSFEEIKEALSEKETIDLAFMLTGMNMLGWIEDWKNHRQTSKKKLERNRDE